MTKKLKATLNIECMSDEFYWYLDFVNKEIDQCLTSSISSKKAYKTPEKAREAGKKFIRDYGIKCIEEIFPYN